MITRWYSVEARMAVLLFAIIYAAIAHLVDLWKWWRWEGWSGWPR